MSHNYNNFRWPSRGQPPQQGAVGHEFDRLPVGVTWPKAVGSHPIHPYTAAGSEVHLTDQGILQVSYPSILNAPGSRRGAVMTNPSATAQLHQPLAPHAQQPLMRMPMYRPVSPPSSPPHHAPSYSYPMEAASSNRVSPPPGFPAKEIARSNKEVPVTLRLNLPVPATARPREMASPPTLIAAMPTVSRTRRSSVSPRNKCICQRAHCKVLCSICKQASRGRVRLQCPQHPHTIHLMDYDCCPNCKAVNLTEVELRPN